MALGIRRHTAVAHLVCSWCSGGRKPTPPSRAPANPATVQPPAVSSRECHRARRRNSHTCRGGCSRWGVACRHAERQGTPEPCGFLQSPGCPAVRGPERSSSAAPARSSTCSMHSLRRRNDELKGRSCRVDAKGFLSTPDITPSVRRLCITIHPGRMGTPFTEPNSIIRQVWQLVLWGQAVPVKEKARGLCSTRNSCAVSSRSGAAHRTPPHEGGEGIFSCVPGYQSTQPPELSGE
jgi:hypothetical protein